MRFLQVLSLLALTPTATTSTQPQQYPLGNFEVSANTAEKPYHCNCKCEIIAVQGASYTNTGQGVCHDAHMRQREYPLCDQKTLGACFDESTGFNEETRFDKLTGFDGEAHMIRNWMNVGGIWDVGIKEMRYWCWDGRKLASV
jgi:hypothetical protein